MSKIITTDKCESCLHGIVDDLDKASIKVFCKYKEREYYYGVCIPCDGYCQVDKSNGGNNESN